MQEPVSVGQSDASDGRGVRRSFTLLFLDVTFFLGGFAMFDSSTILPSFLATLTDSPVLIGLIMGFRGAGLLLPQLWTAYYLRNHTYHMRFLMNGASVSRIAIGLFAILMFFAGPADKTLMLWAFTITFCAMWTSEGYVTVAWTDLVAKTIPERLRGRLFGLTQSAGGVLTILLGVLTAYMLGDSGPAYPRGYAVLFGIAALFFIGSFAVLAFVREPKGVPEGHDDSFREYIKSIVRLIAGHSRLKHLLAVQFLLSSFNMSLAFYVLSARDTAGIGPGSVGWLLGAQMVGNIVWSGIAGFAGDHRGPKWSIVSTAIIGVFAPVMALFLGDAPLWAYCVLFFTIGGTMGTMWIGITNYLLELAAPHERKTYIGLLNTVNAPSMIFPVLGGAIIQAVSYRAVFTLTSVTMTAALALALSLKSGKTSNPS